MREKTGHSHTAKLEVAPPECDFMSVCRAGKSALELELELYIPAPLGAGCRSALYARALMSVQRQSALVV